MNQTHPDAMNRIVVLFLTAAFAGLTLDLRYEHNHVVARHWTAWIPIIYSGIMIVVGVVGLSRWEQGGRQALLWAFSAALVVGVIGYYQHNAGHLFSDLGRWLSVWAGQHPDPVEQPPVVAPLAFAALGTAGILACARRMQPPRAL